MYTIIISEFVNLKNHILAERYLAREEAGGLPLLSLNAESDFFDAFGQTGILHILQNSRHALFSSTSVKGSPGFYGKKISMSFLGLWTLTRERHTLRSVGFYY